MKRRILGVSLFSILLSISVFGAAVWVGSQYIETFQNGFKFGNANILKVSNEVPEFEDASGNVKRLDDKDKSTFAMFDAEDSVITGFTNITVTSVSPLSDLNSYSVSSFPATLPVVTLQERNKGEDGKTNAVLFQYRMTSGTAKAVVKDNLANIVAEVELSAKTASTPVVLDGFVGSALTTIQLELQDVSSATGLVIDDVEFSDDPFKYKNLIEEHIITHSGHTSRDGSNRIVYATTNDNGGNILTTSTSLGYTRVQFLKDASFSISASYIGVNSSELTIVRARSSDDAQIQRSRDSSASNGVTTTSMVGYAQAGDYIAVASSQAPNNQIETNFEIKAQTVSEHIVTPNSPDDVVVTGQNNGGTLINGLVTPIDFTETEDTHDAWDGNTFTAPYTGIYSYSGVIAVSSSINTILYAYKSTDDGSSYNQVPESLSGFRNSPVDHHSFNGSIKLNKGDKFQIRSNSTLTLSATNLHVLTISRSSVKADASAFPRYAEPTANGVEYKVNEKWFGKQVYARSWDVSVNTSVGATDHLLATTVTGLDVIKYEFIGLEGVYWRSLQHGATNAFLARFRYNTSNGQITVRTDGVAFTRERFTLYYTK